MKDEVLATRLGRQEPDEVVLLGTVAVAGSMAGHLGDHRWLCVGDRDVGPTSRLSLKRARQPKRNYGGGEITGWFRIGGGWSAADDGLLRVHSHGITKDIAMF